MARVSRQDALVAKLRDDMAALQKILDYVTACAVEPATEPKAKRPRKTRKGLPATDASGNV